MENKVLNILNEATIIPQLYSSGDWGYSYEFVEGEELCHRDLNNRALHEIVDTMIDMTMLVESTDEPEENEEMRRFENVVTNCRKISKEMGQHHPKKVEYNKGLISDLLSDEVVRNILKILPQESVFSHNDVNLTNLIKTNKGLMLMDYEFSCQNYIGFDLGNLFNELTTEYSDVFEIKS